MTSFDHVGVIVRDLEVTEKFYCDVFGAVVQSKPSSKFLEMTIGGARFHFLKDLNKQVSPEAFSHICIAVDSLDRLEEIRATATKSPYADNLNLQIINSPPQSDLGNAQVEQYPPLKTLYLKDPNHLMVEVRVY